MIEQVKHTYRKWPSGLKTFNDPVHSDADKCGRQEITIKGVIEAQCDMTIYAFSTINHEFGIDPWRVIEGIDPWIDGKKADIWSASGACSTILIDDNEWRFFVSKKDLEKLK